MTQKRKEQSKVLWMRKKRERERSKEGKESERGRTERVLEHLLPVLVGIHVPDEKTRVEREHSVAETRFKIQSESK